MLVQSLEDQNEVVRRVAKEAIEDVFGTDDRRPELVQAYQLALKSTAASSKESSSKQGDESGVIGRAGA